MSAIWRRFPTPVLAEVALVIVTVVAAALVYGGFFASADYLPVIALACLAGAVAAAAAAARRWHVWTTILMGAGGFALFATYAVFGDTAQDGLPTSRTGSDLLHGVLGGWARMLTVEPPADTWDELMVTPVLVVWAAAFVSVTLTMRTRSPLAPVAPSLVAFVLALLTVGNQPGEHKAATVMFLTATVSLISIRAHRIATSDGTRSDRRTRRVRAGGLTIILSVLFGILGGQALPLASGRHRFDPRDLLSLPITLGDSLTPLAMLKPQLTETPPRALFTVRIDRENAARISQVRTAALDAFDGITWTTTDAYRVAGSHLAPDPALTKARSVAARIEVTGLPGPFLPVLGWPSRIATGQQNPGDVGFDARSGVLVSTTPTLRGLRYSIEGKISNHDGGLPLAMPSTSPELARYRVLPIDTPPSLRVVARQHAGGRSSPYAQLTALESYLRTQPYSLSAPPGHSYAAIVSLLTDDRYRNNSAYAEQHAAAFTVLARTLGYPARVAVGYRLRDYHDGAYTVTTADAHAWPEVHFAGYGWVAFEPTDTSKTTVDPPPPPPEIPLVAPQRPTEPPAAPPAAEPPPAAAGRQAGFDWHGVLRGTAALVVGIVALVASTALVITVEKARRRRRRRRARDPVTRVLGAWHELVDRLAEQGIALPVSLTAQEVAGHARTVLGSAASSVAAMAPLATTAMFEPGQLDRHAVDHAWQLSRQLHTDLYPRRISLRRLRAAVNPCPLWTDWYAARERRRAWKRLELGRYR